MKSFVAKDQRPLSSIPKWVIIFFSFGICLQVAWYEIQRQTNIRVEFLPSAPQTDILKLSSMGEPEVLAKVLMLWLQAFDNQPGVSIPFSSLNYNELKQWLNIILELDPRSGYPLLAASRIYTQVPDPKKQRQMMELVYQQYLNNPGQRWPWLAHVTILAKHHLKDHELALKYAHALADKKLSNEVPAWVRQLEIVVLEDMGELESVRILVGGLIHNNTITDAKELYWLEQRLNNLEAIKFGNNH